MPVNEMKTVKRQTAKAIKRNDSRALQYNKKQRALGVRLTETERCVCGTQRPPAPSTACATRLPHNAALTADRMRARGAR